MSRRLLVSAGFWALAKKMKFQPNYRPFLFNYGIILFIFISVPVIKKYDLSGLYTYIIEFLPIILFVFLLLAMQIVREFEFTDNYLQIKNVITRRVIKVPYYEIVDIHERNFPFRELITCTLSIQTKTKKIVVYPRVIKNHSKFKETLKEHLDQIRY